MSRENYFKYFQITIIVVLGLALLKELWGFSGGFLGAFTVYVLVRKQMAKLTDVKKIRKSLVALIIILEVVVCFLIPLPILFGILLKVADTVAQNSESLQASIENVVVMLREKFDLDVTKYENISYIYSNFSGIGKVLLNESSSIIINAFVLIFVLYFMLISSKQMESYIYDLLPFSEKNKRTLVSKIKMMIISNAIGIPLLAIIQGLIATGGYFLFGTPMPLLFGLLTCFASVIPIIGTALVWAPLTIYLIVTGDYGSGVGLLLYGGLVISNVDNLFRFVLQKKMADIHPLVTVFGVIAGLSLYGFWGIIFGPVVLSMFFVLVDMFKDEYLTKKTKEENLVDK